MGNAHLQLKSRTRQLKSNMNVCGEGMAKRNVLLAATLDCCFNKISYLIIIVFILIGVRNFENGETSQLQAGS